MPRGIKRAEAAPSNSIYSTNAGRWLDDEPAAAAPAAAPTPAQRRGAADGLRRQTLDIPRDHYRTLHYWADAMAETMHVTSRQINAQTVLRELVARYVNDEELRDSINRDIRKPYS